jgi:hypothetical protein
MTWHDGRTAGYSAFLGVTWQPRTGVAVLADTSDGEQTRAIALRLLGYLSARR